MTEVPMEFIPPTIVLIAAAAVWLHILIARQVSRPVKVPELTVADAEAAWARTAPLRENALHADPYDHEREGL